MLCSMSEEKVKRRVERKSIDNRDGGTYSSSDCGVCLCTYTYCWDCRGCWDVECESLGGGSEMYLGEGMGGEDDYGCGKSVSAVGGGGLL